MTKSETDILKIIVDNPGIKARDIANKLNVERGQVNSILYGSLRTRCYQDPSYCWFVNGTSEKTDEQTNALIPDKNLSSRTLPEVLSPAPSKGHSEPNCRFVLS
jgi:hypothetical protein